MKQVLQNRSGLTVIRDVPAPACPKGGVLVRNAFSVISAGTERARLELAKKSLVGKALERPDLVRQVIDRARTEGVRSTRAAIARQLGGETPIGYSSAGTIIEVGAGVRGLAVGDRVACCGGGHANHAEIVAMPRNLVAKVPDGVSCADASLTTIAAIALNGIRLAGVDLGQRVAVVGCGLVGQMACRLLTAAGAEVFAVDIDPLRVESAVQAGASFGAVTRQARALIRQETGGVGVDASIITAAGSDNQPLLLAADVVRDRGAVVLVGAVPIDFPRAVLYDKELFFRVSRSYGPGRYDAEYEERGLDYPIGYVRWTEQRNLEAVLSLQARGRLVLSDLIEELIPVELAAEAYARLVGPPETRPRGALVLSYPSPRDAVPAKGVDLDIRAPRREGSRAVPRLGLIGPGSFAMRVLLPAFVATGVVLECVAGGAGPSAELAVRRGGFRRFVGSEEALIADNAVDVVAVCTRHSSHAELVTRAIRAGKHVFCEKPLALDAGELATVLTAAAEAPGILTVGFNRRFSPHLQQAREFLAGQGPLTAIYRVSAGQIAPEHWVHDLDQGGGRVLGEVCHFIDSLRFLAGCDVTSVHAAGHGLPTLPVQAQDNVVVSLGFSDRSVATVVYSAVGSPKVSKERLEAFGGRRSVVLDDFRRLELLGPDRAEVRKASSASKGHREEIEAFIASIRDGRPPIPLEEIANVTLATIAVVESLRTGRPVSL